MPSRHRLLTVIFAVCSMVAGRHAFGQAPPMPQILEIDATSLAHGTLAHTPWQNVALDTACRGVNPDGSLREPGLMGLMISGNPWQDSLRRDRADGRVRLDSGTLSLTEADLEFPAIGPTWTIGRTWHPASVVAGVSTWSTGPQGHNWFQSSRPEILIDPGQASTDWSDDRVHIIYGGDRFLTFKRLAKESAPTQGSDTYRGVNGAAGAIVHVASASGQPERFVYFDGEGSRAEFLGVVGVSRPSARQQLWRIEDGAKRSAFVGSDSDANLAVQDGFDDDGVRFAYDSAGRRFEYAYASVPGSPSMRRLAGVSVRARATQAEPWNIVIGDVQYDYYDADGVSGLRGDLRLVRVITPLSARADGTTPLSMRRTHYRYWVESHSTNAPGHPHRVRLIVSEEGVRRFLSENPGGESALLAASDSTVRPYAELEIEYDTLGRVSRVREIGGDPMVAPDVVRSFSHEQRPGQPPTAYSPEWLTRTIVADPTGWTTYYFDSAGQSLSVATTRGDPAQIESGGTSEAWVLAITRDQTGNVITVRSPAAVASYSPATPAAVFTPSSSGGLVTDIERVDASSTQAEAGVAGFVNAVRHRTSNEGASAARFDSSLEYRIPDAQGGSILVSADSGYRLLRPLLSAVRRFDEESTDPALGVLTSMSYQFHGGAQPSLRIRRKDVIDPPASVDNNGDGVSYHTRTFYDEGGRVRFTRSRTGRINYFAYDPANGQLVRSVQDADTNTDDVAPEYGAQSPVPSDFATDSTVSSGLLLRRVRGYEYDAQGRIAAEIHTTGRRSAVAYSRLADERLVVVASPRVDGDQVYGPLTAAVVGHDGRTHTTLTMGADRADNQSVLPKWYLARYATLKLANWIDPTKSDVLDAIPTAVGSFSVKRGLVSALLYSKNGRFLTEGRRFNALPASYVDASWLNDPSRFTRTRLRYDTSGRIARVEDRTGTIDAYEYDSPLSRLVARRRGTNDSTTANNMTLVESFQYDEGLLRGDSLLTKATKYARRGEQGAEETRNVYDYRGRLKGQANATSPHFLISYDNQGRAIELAALEGSQSSVLPLLASSEPSTPSLQPRRALTRWTYDELGRLVRTKRVYINPVDGGMTEDHAGAVAHNVYYGGEHAVRAESGTGEVRYERDRGCGITCVLKMVSNEGDNPRPNPPGSSWLNGAHSLEETHYIRDLRTGQLKAVVNASILTDGPCIGPDAPSRLLPGGGISWNPDGSLDIQYNPASVPNGAPIIGQLDVGMIWYGPTDQEHMTGYTGYTGFKDPSGLDTPSISINIQWNGYDGSSPKFTRNGKPWFQSPFKYNASLGNSLGLPWTNVGVKDGKQFTYDDGGRLIGTNTISSPAITENNPCRPPVIGVPTIICPTQPPGGYDESIEYDPYGRPKSYKPGVKPVESGIDPSICAGSNACVPNATDFLYPDTLPSPNPMSNPIFGVADDYSNLPPGQLPYPGVSDNNLVVGMSTPNDQGSTVAPVVRKEWYTYDAQGRRIGHMRPGGDRFLWNLDANGLPIKETRLPGHGREEYRAIREIQRGFDGQAYRVIERGLRPVGGINPIDEIQPTSQVDIARDAWGNTEEMNTWLYGTAPVGGQPMSMTAKYWYDLYHPSGNSHVRPTDIEQPGGLFIRPKYSTLPPVGCPTGPNDFYPINLDDRLGRLTETLYWGMAIPAPGNRPVTPANTKPVPQFFAPPGTGGYHPIEKQGWHGIYKPKVRAVEIERPSKSLKWNEMPYGGIAKPVDNPSRPGEIQRQPATNPFGEPDTERIGICQGDILICDPGFEMPWKETQFPTDVNWEKYCVCEVNIPTDSTVKKDEGIPPNLCSGATTVVTAPTITYRIPDGTNNSPGEVPPYPNGTPGTTVTEVIDPCAERMIYWSGTLKPPSGSGGGTQLTTPPSTQYFAGLRVEAYDLDYHGAVRTYTREIEPDAWRTRPDDLGTDGPDTFNGELSLRNPRLEAEGKLVHATISHRPSFELDQMEVHLRQPWTNAPVTAPSVRTISHDSNGNVTDNGLDFVFEYDDLGRLTKAFHRVETAPGSNVFIRGPLFARFTYDALGRRASAVYNLHGWGSAPTAPPPGDTPPLDVFADETTEWFGYDDAWRLVCVWRQGPVDGTGARPPPRVYERIVHRQAGVVRGTNAALGHAAPLDAPLYSQIDSDGDGVFERDRFFAQNSMGDIVGVWDRPAAPPESPSNPNRNHEAGPIFPGERVAYSVWGVPRLTRTWGGRWVHNAPPGDTPPGTINGQSVPDAADWQLVGGSPAIGADFDNGFGLGTPDGGVGIEDLLYYISLFEAGDIRADVDNGDGKGFNDAGVGIEDLLYYLWLFEAAHVGDLSDNRFGYRGYLWDEHLNIYHVRFRVYDPRLMQWLQPDPAGFVDGINRYAYLGGKPWSGIDPYGLWKWDGGLIQYGLGGMLGFHGAEAAKDGWLRLGQSIIEIPRSSKYIEGIQEAIDSADRLTQQYEADAGRPLTTLETVQTYAGEVAGASKVAGGHVGIDIHTGQVLSNDNRVDDVLEGGVQFVGAATAPVLLYEGVTSIQRPTRATTSSTKTSTADGAECQTPSALDKAKAVGNQGEAAVPGNQNTGRIPSASQKAAYRTPDRLDPVSGTIGEIKNVAKQDLTSQILDDIAYAKANNLKFELWTRSTTQLSGPLQDAIKRGDIVHRIIPGT